MDEFKVKPFVVPHPFPLDPCLTVEDAHRLIEENMQALMEHCETELGRAIEFGLRTFTSSE